MNTKITNIGKRIVGLQKITLAHGVFGGPVPPGESIVVPPEYIEKSRSEKGFTSILGVNGRGAEIELSDTSEEAKPFAKVRAAAKGIQVTKPTSSIAALAEKAEKLGMHVGALEKSEASSKSKR